jgi:hypothetical protein
VVLFAPCVLRKLGVVRVEFKATEDLNLCSWHPDLYETSQAGPASTQPAVKEAGRALSPSRQGDRRLLFQGCLGKSVGDIQAEGWNRK